jgi:hypothetical protein
VATERGNIAPHPLECGELIEKPVVAGRFTCSGQRRVHEEPEPTQSVVESHHGQALSRERAD